MKLNFHYRLYVSARESSSSDEDDLNNMTITAGTPGIMMSAKKVKQEMHLPITPVETVRGKKKVKYL